MDGVRMALQPVYPALRMLYAHASTYANAKWQDGFLVDLNTFSKIITDSKILKKCPEVDPDTLDRIFISTKPVPPSMVDKVPSANKRGVIRFQFLETLLRIAQNIEPDSEETSLEEHIQDVLGSCFVPLGQYWEENITDFQSICFTERVDGIFKCSLKGLRRVFAFYAGQHQTRPEKTCPMIVSEWLEVLKELHLLDAYFHKKMAPWAFAVGHALVPEEATTMRHMEINFVEFLYALGYVIFCRAAKMEDGVDSFPEVLEEVLDEPLSKLQNKGTPSSRSSRPQRTRSSTGRW
jgi:hypothetical protein